MPYRIAGIDVHKAMLAVAVSVMLPPDWAKVKESLPAVCVMDTRVEPAGSVSDRTTPWAALGPLLVMVMV